MASRRKEYKEDAKLRVMQMINQNLRMTSRDIAEKVGISNGSAHYLVISLIDKGYVLYGDFKEHSQKLKYSYILTPKGIREKSLLNQKFLCEKNENIKC